MTTFYIGNDGGIYHGDMRAGDRKATAEEVAAHEKRTLPARAAAQIRALEAEQMMPRAMREFMLLTMKKQAVAKRPPSYAKLKELDDKIASLRAAIGGT